VAKPDLMNYTRGQNIEVEIGNDTLIELPPGSTPQQMMEAITAWHQSAEAGEYWDPRENTLLEGAGQYQIQPVNETVRDKIFNTAIDFLTSPGDDPIARQRAIRRAQDVTTSLDLLPGTGDAILLGDAQAAYNNKDFLEAAVLTGIAAVGAVPVIGDAGANALKKLKGNNNLGKDVIEKLNLWHGSPNKFDQFDMSKAGDQAGQARGHGAYLSESREVGERYSDLGASEQAWTGEDRQKVVDRFIEEYPDALPGEGRTAGDLMTGDSYELQRMINDYGSPEFISEMNATRASGSLYNVEVDATSDEMLDYDAPLSEQSDKVKLSLESLKKEPWFTYDDSAKGSAVYDAMSDYYGSRQIASEKLDEMGVRGMRYADETGDTEGGVSNFVVFDESRMNVLTRDGEPVTGAQRQEAIDAWHGSPHTFDEFSLEKIGTGEGAQAYGHGLYFADKPGVASEYKKQGQQGIGSIRRYRPDIDELSDEAWDEITPVMRKYGMAGDIQPNQTQPGMIRGLLDDYGDRLSAAEKATLEQYALPEGSLYNVDINVSQADLLNYDAPFSTQSETVQNALNTIYKESSPGSFKDSLEGKDVDQLLKVADDMDRNNSFRELEDDDPPWDVESLKEALIYSFDDADMADYMEGLEALPGQTGGSVYNQLASRMTDQEISKRMSELGVPGIRYSDAISRSTNMADRKMDNLVAKHNGDIEAGLAEFMQGIHEAPAEKAKMEEQFRRTLQNKTNNYVIFDPDNISVKTRNGEPVTGAARDETLSSMGVVSQSPGAEGFDARYGKGIGTDVRVGETPKLEGLQRIVSEAQYEVPEISLADMEGRPFITHYSDRTDAGRTLQGVDGEEFAPVDLQGGQDYMFTNPGSVWAGGKAPATGYMRMADQIRQSTGQDPLFIPWRMTPTGSDFSSMTGETMISHASANMRPGAKRSLNARLKKLIPGFKSVDDPESLELYRGLSGRQRNQVMQVMDRDFRDRGGLSVSQARMAVSAPDQVNAPQFGLQNIGEIDSRGTLTESAHNTYPQAIPGQGIGRLQENLEVFDIIPEYIRAKGYDRTQPEEGLRRSLEMNPVSGIIDADLLKKLGL